MKDFYLVLGLQRSADYEKIKKAYRKLSIKFHPDKNDGDEFFEERFKQIQEAYELLSNSNSKKLYDDEYDIFYNYKPNLNSEQYENQKSGCGLEDYQNTDTSNEIEEDEVKYRIHVEVSRKSQYLYYAVISLILGGGLFFFLSFIAFEVSKYDDTDFSTPNYNLPNPNDGLFYSQSKKLNFNPSDFADVTTNMNPGMFGETLVQERREFIYMKSFKYSFFISFLIFALLIINNRTSTNTN